MIENVWRLKLKKVYSHTVTLASASDGTVTLWSGVVFERGWKRRDKKKLDSVFYTLCSRVLIPNESIGISKEIST